MYFVNNSKGSIVLAGVLNGNDLIIPAESRSLEFVPNKSVLSKALANIDNLEVHVTSGSQINAVHEIDPRFDTLLILDD